MDKKLSRKFTTLSKLGLYVFDHFPKCIIRFIIRLCRFGESNLSFGLRYLCYSQLCSKFGKKVIIFPAVYIFSCKNLKLGTNISLHEFSYIDATGGISIGDNVMIGHRCTIMSSNHKFDNKQKIFKNTGLTLESVNIGNNCWIGADVKILAGITIGDNCVVGAGAVVNEDVQSNTLVAGIPATKIKDLL